MGKTLITGGTIVTAADTYKADCNRMQAKSA